MRLKLIAVILLVSIGANQQAQAADVQTFVSPDSSYPALLDFVAGASGSIVVATYTFSSPDIMDMLIEKRGEGIPVEVMVEKSPAGGISDTEHAILCTLADNGIPVLLYDGQARYMHAKYLIRDGSSALVTSENMGSTGFFQGGDYGNRGWGAIVHDPGLAGDLAGIFEEDKRVSVPFACVHGNYTVPVRGRGGDFRPVLSREAYHGQVAGLIVSPDSLEAMLSLIASANSSVDVEQYYAYQHWGSLKDDTVDTAPSPLIESLIERARHGIRVRLLLDSTYFNMDEEKGVSNWHTVEYVNSVAEREGIPIEAKAIDLDEKGLAKVHNKGMVIDRKTALVSSINWNENSVRKNREIGVAISGEAAGYYAKAFELDWTEGGPDYGLGLIPALASLAALVLVIAYFGWRNQRNPVG
jgi:cardiolipin synthase